MKLVLEAPFKDLWSHGYVVVNSENRRNVCLFNSNADRTTTSYARYLMCVKLGYILPPELEVDHIDEDKTNDDISNLQVLTQQQNLQKAGDVRKSKTLLTHGTLSSYRYCKCNLCKDAMRQYNKMYNQKRISTVI